MKNNTRLSGFKSFFSKQFALVVGLMMVAGTVLHAQSIGDYRNTAATTLNSLTSWQVYDGAAWQTSSQLILGNGIYSSGGITQSATTTNASSTVVLAANNSLIRVGQYVSGTGITSGTTVTAITGAQTVSTTGNVNSGTNTITNVPSITGVSANMIIAGIGIPSGTKVSSTSGSTGNYTITMNANANGSITGTAITIDPEITLSGNATSSATNTLTFTDSYQASCTTTAGTSTVALTNANTLLSTGMAVSGTGISGGAIISSTSATGFTLYTPSNNTGCSTTSASKSVTLGSSDATINPGMYVTGAGITAGTIVSSVSGVNLTLSANATATATGVTLSFSSVTFSATSTLTFCTTQTTTNSFASGASSITLATANSLVTTGMLITGTTNIAAGTYVTSVSGNMIGISLPTTGAQGSGIGLVFGYNVIPHLYINFTASTGNSNCRQSTIGSVFVNDVNSSNAGTGSGVTPTSSTLSIGYTTTGGGSIDFECSSVTIAALATLSTSNTTGTYTNTMEIYGSTPLSVTNGGTVNFTTTTGGSAVTNVTFAYPGNTSIASTTNTLYFNTLALNMGGSVSNTLTMSAVFSIASAVTSQTLTITSGTLNITSASTITPYGSTNATICSSTGGLTINNSSATINTGGGSTSALTSHTVSGALTVTAGVFNLGSNANPVALTMGASPASVTINGGTVNVYGSYFVNNTGSTTISSGSLNIPAGGAITQASEPVLKLGNAGNLSFTGGSINVKSRNAYSGSTGDIYISTSGTWTVSGSASFNFSDAQYVTMTTNQDLKNVSIAQGGGSGTTLLMYGNTTISNSLTIDAVSALDAASYTLTAASTTASGSGKIRTLGGGTLTNTLAAQFTIEYYNSFSINTTLTSSSTSATLDQTNPYYKFVAYAVAGSTSIVASGTGVPAGTYIAGASSLPTVTLSQAATVSATNSLVVTMPASANLTTGATSGTTYITSGSNVMTVSSASSIVPGQVLANSNGYFPNGTYVLGTQGLQGTTVLLSQAATATYTSSGSSISLIAYGYVTINLPTAVTSYSTLNVNYLNAYLKVNVASISVSNVNFNNTAALSVNNNTLQISGAVTVSSATQNSMQGGLSVGSGTVVFNGTSAQSLPNYTFNSGVSNVVNGYAYTTNASNSITLAATYGTLYTGMLVTGTGIPAGTYITAITGTSPTQTLTLSNNATATSSSVYVPLYFTNEVYTITVSNSAGVTLNQNLFLIGYLSNLTFTNSGLLTVASGVTLTGTSGNTAPVVANGCTLTINNGGTLALNNGFNLAGTLNIGQSALSSTAVYGTAATVTLGSAGTYTWTSPTINLYGYLQNKSTTAISGLAVNAYSVYEHAVTGGTIPTATWPSTSTLYVTGTGGTAPSGISQSFGNIIWNCINQSTPVAINSTSITGALTVINTHTTTLRVSSTASSSVAIGNGISVGGSTSFNGGTISATTATLDLATANGVAVAVTGGVTIGSNGTLQSSNTSTLSLTGNWSNGGTFTQANTTVNFNNSTPINQNISSTVFNNLTINNTAGVTLTGNVWVGGTLTLTAGRVTTGANTLALSNVTSSSAALSGTPSTSAYINGNLKRYVSNSYTSWVFPIGQYTGGTDYYYPFTLNTISTTGTDSVTVYATKGSTGGTSDGTTGTLSTNEYWTVVATPTISSTLTVNSADIGSNTLLGASTTLAGTYTSIGGISPSNATSLSSTALYIVPALTAQPPPTISSISSSYPSGTTTFYRGSVLTITGTNFISGTTSVSIGGASVVAANVTYNSSTSISFTVPSGCTGNSITVTTTTGGSSSAYTSGTYNSGYLSVANADWSTASTWGANAVPPAGSTVIVNSMVTINANVASPANLTISSGDSLSLGTTNSGAQIIVSSSFTNNGTLNVGFPVGNYYSYFTINGTGTNNGNINIHRGSSNDNLILGAALANSGTIVDSAILQINNGGSVTGTGVTYGSSANLYYNTGSTAFTPTSEWVAGATSGAGVPQNVIIGANQGSTIASGTNLSITGSQTMLGNLTINSTYSATIGSSAVVSCANFSNAGTATVTGNINASGSWTNSGTFTATAGTVSLTGGSQTITGSSTFYNLTKSVASAATLTLPAGGTQTVNGVLTLNGASGQLLTITSSAASTIAPANPASASIFYTSITNVTNSNSTSIYAVASTNGGNNTNIIFNSYTWTGATSTDYTVATNWTPSRSFVSTADVLYFNNGTINTVSNVPTQTIYQLFVSGTNTTVDLQAGTAANVLTVSGDNNTSTYDVTVAAGDSLNLIGTNELIVRLGTNATVDVLGNVRLDNAIQVLDATYSSGALINFESGSTCQTGINFPSANSSGNYPFTNISINDNARVVFKSGSKYYNNGGNTPIGGSGSVQSTSFLTGSTYYHQQSGTAAYQMGVFAVSQARTFGIFVWNNASTSTGTAGSASTTTFDSIAVLQGSFGSAFNNATGYTTLNLNKGVYIATGARLVLGSTTNATQLTFQGSAAQYINGGGNLILGNSGTTSSTNPFTINVNNSNGVILQDSLTSCSTTPTYGGTGTINATSSNATLYFVQQASLTIPSIFGTTIGNLNVQTGTGNVLSLSGATTIANNLTITNGTLDVTSANNYGLTVGGNFSNSGTFNAEAGTVTLNGTSQTLSGGNSFYNLTRTTAGTLTITSGSGNVQTITGTLTLTGVSGNLLNVKSSSTSAQAYITPSNISINYTDISWIKSNNVITVSHSSNGGNNTNIYFGGGITWTGATDTKWTTASNWSTGTLPLSTDSAVIATTTSNQLTLDANETVGNLIINDANNFTIGAYALTVNGVTTIGNGTSGSLVTSSNATTSTFTGAVTLNAGATWNNSGNANVTLSGALVNAGTFTAGSGTTSIGGSLTNTGTFNQTSGTFNFSGTGSSSITSTTGSYTTNFYNLTLSGTKTITTGGSTFGVNNNLSIGDGTTLQLANTYVTVTGTTTVGNGTSGELYISSSSGTKTFTGDVTVNAGATLLNSGNGNINFGGNFINNGTLTSSGSTITLTATSTKSISGSGTYGFGSLVFNGVGGSWTMPSGQSIAGTFTITNGTFTAPSTLTLNNTFTNNGTFNANGGTLIFASSFNFYGSATTFNNITVNSGVSFATGVSGCIVVGNIVNNGTFATTNTLNFSATTNTAGILSGSGTYNFNSVVISASSYLTAPSNMNISGSYTNNGTYYNNSGTVTFNGTGTCTISGNLTASTNGAFNNVTFSSTGTYQFANSAHILGNFNNSGTGTVKATTTVSISVGGTWNNSGTFNNANTTIKFNGTSAQTIPATAFNSLTISNSSGVTLTGNVTVAGILTMSAGLLNPSSYTLTVTNTAAGAVTGGSSTCYINGALTQAVAAGSTSYIFPVGNGGVYLADTITSTSAAGNITITPTASSSGGSYDGSLASISTNEYWTVNSSVANTVTLVVRPTTVGSNGVLAQATTASGTYTSDGGFVTTTSIGAPSISLASGNNYFVVATSIIPAPTITAVSSCVTGTNSFYAMDTLTLTGTNFQATSTVSVGGYTATVLSTTNVPTSLKVLVSPSANSNTITVNNQGGTTTYSTANGNAIATFLVGYVTRNNGSWNTGSTWLGGTQPTGSAVVATINNLVTMSSSVSNISSLTINSGDSLGCSNIGLNFTTAAATLVNNGKFTGGNSPSINGTITNNGSMIFTGGTLTSTGNLTINGSAPITFSSISTPISTSGTITFTTAPTITSALTINSGGSIAGNAPTYSTTSGGVTYNQVGTVTPGIEWTAGATSGAGVPYRVTVNAGNTLSLNSGTYKVLYLLDLYGNVSSGGGSLDLSASQVWFMGSSSIAINIGTAQPNVYSLTINNTSGTTLGCNMTVTHAITFQSGVLNTASGDLLTVASTAYLTGYSSSTYINGPLAKAVTSTTASVFPIGIRGVYQPLTLTYSSTPFASEVVTITPSSATIPGTVPSNVSTAQFDSTSWNIAQTVTGYSYTIGIGNGGTSNTSGGSVVIARREGTGSYTVNTTLYSSPTYTNTSAFSTTNASNDVFLAETNIPLTIIGAVVSNKPYDGTTSATLSSVGTLSGIVGSDAVSIASESVAFSNKNVGTGVSIIANYSINGTNAGAYSITQPTLTANITALSLTITASNQNKNYGSSLSSTSTQFTSSGLLSGETIATVTLNYNGGGAASAAVGTYTITPSNPVAGSGAFLASNYSITYVNGTLTVIAGTHGQWVGNTSTNFNTNTNWADGQVPSAGDNVIINTGATYYPILTTNDTIGSLVIASGTTLGLGGYTLTINNEIDGSGTLTSTSASSLVLNGTTGTINLTSGNNTIENLTLNTGASATLGGQTLIAADVNAGTVTIGSGATLNTGGNLVLLSDSLGTASLAQLQGTLSGNVTVQRYISAKTARKFTFVGSPVTESIHNAWQQQVYITGAGSGGSLCGSSNSNGFDVTATNYPSMFTYDSVQVSGTRWVSVPNTSGNLTPGTGYSMNIRGDRTLGSCANELGSNSPAPPTAVTLSATGPVDTGNVVIALHNPTLHIYTLLANPYPSTMSFTSLYLDNEGSINDNVWTYSPFGNGNYTTYSSGTLVNGATGYGGLGASGDYIASGQAFFVQAANTSATTASVTFQESDKVNTVLPNTQYFGGALNKLLRVGLKTTDNTNLDEIVVRFRSNGSKAYNAAIDAASLNTGTQVLVVLKGSNSTAIATYPDDANADTAQLGVSSTSTGTFELVFSDYQGIDSTKSITLIDNFLGTTQDVRANQVYDFNVTSNTASQGNNRFVVVFGADANPLPVSFESLTATKNNTGVAVKWTVANQLNIADYEVERSTDGNNFTAITTSKAINATAYSIEDEHLPAAATTLYYRIKSIGVDGSYKYSSIAKLTTYHSPLITIYPNPVQEKLNITLGAATNGTYKVRILSVAGVEVFSKQSVAANGNTIILDAGSLAGGVYVVELTDEFGNKQQEKFVKN